MHRYTHSRPMMHSTKSCEAEHCTDLQMREVIEGSIQTKKDKAIVVYSFIKWQLRDATCYLSNRPRPATMDATTTRTSRTCFNSRCVSRHRRHNSVRASRVSETAQCSVRSRGHDLHRRTLRLEARGRAITCNACSPSWISKASCLALIKDSHFV